MSSPNICILILNHNGSSDTLAAIESLEEQMHRVERVFILDNGSNQEQQQMLQSIESKPQVEVISSAENLGFTGGFNHLFEKALSTKADYILVLNNDTIATAGFLDSLMEVAQPNTIVSPMVVWENDRDTIIQSAGEFDRNMMKMDNWFEGKSQSEYRGQTLSIGQSDGCCFLLHRHWLEQGFRFDDDFFIYFEDMDFFLRLRAAGATFLYQAQSTLYHKEYGSSGGRHRPSALRNYYFYRNRMLLARKLHPWHIRPRVYWRLMRLAREKFLLEQQTSTDAAKAIPKAIFDFFTGKKGPCFEVHTTV